MHGTFTPVIYSITGGMGREAEIYHKCLNTQIAHKKGQAYGDVTRFIRC